MAGAEHRPEDPVVVAAVAVFRRVAEVAVFLLAAAECSDHSCVTLHGLFGCGGMGPDGQVVETGGHCFSIT